ncbi:hypothetical protein J6590_107698, partial [Homalodisca vitripennis]
TESLRVNTRGETETLMSKHCPVFCDNLAIRHTYLLLVHQCYLSQTESLRVNTRGETETLMSKHCPVFCDTTQLLCYTVTYLPTVSASMLLVSDRVTTCKHSGRDRDTNEQTLSCLL